jgi:hypothetical protein
METKGITASPREEVRKSVKYNASGNKLSISSVVKELKLMQRLLSPYIVEILYDILKMHPPLLLTPTFLGFLSFILFSVIVFL